ncbi:MAG: response regulator [Polyangiaceae bacterium]|nr:response regulator [Polyangiaceae bacterium]
MSTIVCVDDEAAVCSVFRRVLTKTGANVRTFTDARAALDYLREHEAVLVVCDYRMPALNGLELLARLPRATPFVMISGDLDVHELVADAPGVTAVLQKPFRPEELLALVRRHLPAPSARGRG